MRLAISQVRAKVVNTLRWVAIFKTQNVRCEMGYVPFFHPARKRSLL